MKMDRSIAAIRRRLVLLQLKSFGIVVIISMILILLGVSWVISKTMNMSPLQRLPIVTRLEGFFEGNGMSWDGVETIFSREEIDPSTPDSTGRNFWDVLYLVDDQGFVVYQSDVSNANNLGQLYQRHVRDIVINLKVSEKIVGKLVLNALSIPGRIRILGTLMLPVSGIVIILTAFLIISNYYIVRRIINPLSDTISAANEVASGNLQTRVQVKGPDDLNGLNDTFNAMVTSLEETNTTRREFLADIAHELRTPLTILRGRLEGVLDGIYPPDESHLAPILQETYLLERLVDDLRTLTLAENRQLHFDKKDVDLLQVVHSTVEVFQVQAEIESIQLHLDAPSEPIVVNIDAQRIEQVFGNILQNSFKQLSRGGKIDIRIEKQNDQVVVSISDTGPGVDEADLKHLFDRFWRKDKSRSRQTGGSGLGLAITRQLVEAQGGTIQAMASSSGGLAIQIELPVKLSSSNI
jgi:signal transduction histidine kinase